MNPEKIARINELARTSRERALSEEEKAEQASLRREYIEAVKANVRSALEGVVPPKEPQN